jgi:hypothetical protein
VIYHGELASTVEALAYGDLWTNFSTAPEKKDRLFDKKCCTKNGEYLKRDRPVTAEKVFEEV